MIHEGEKAPDFTLPCADGESIGTLTLSEEIGKENIVLLFFPGAFTSVCTSQMCEVTENLERFNRVNARVFGISVDTPFVHNEFIQKYQLKFPLLSDFNKQAIQSYGVVLEDLLGLKGLAKRSVFIIDKQGVVRYQWVSDDPRIKPNPDEIIQELQKLG